MELLVDNDANLHVDINLIAPILYTLAVCDKLLIC